jgi:hypothetical protein
MMRLLRVLRTEVRIRQRETAREAMMPFLPLPFEHQNGVTHVRCE